MTHSTLRSALVGLFWAAALTASLVAGTKFITSWKAPAYNGWTMAGRTVTVVALTDDRVLRASAEEAMARALSAHAVAAEPSHRLLTIEDLRDRAKAKASLQRRGVQAVVTVRLVPLSQRKAYTPVVWTTDPHYASVYDYWAWGGHEASTPPAAGETRVTLELLLFDVDGGGLAWAGTCETSDPPGNRDRFASSVATEVVKQMRKQGVLLPKARK